MKINLIKTITKNILQIDPFTPESEEHFCAIISISCFKLSGSKMAKPYISLSSPLMIDCDTTKRLSLGLAMAASIVRNVKTAQELIDVYEELNRAKNNAMLMQPNMVH